MIQLNFEKKFVAFLDVLGFKELIFNDNTEKLKTYFTTVSSAVERVERDKKNLTLFLISDSIIIIAEDNHEQFKLLLKAIQTIQIELIQKNIWIRGAIAYGEVDYDIASKIVVGKALTKAYLLEKEASLPRVILEPSIIRHFTNTKYDFVQEMNGVNAYIAQHENKLIHTHFTRTEEDSIFVSYGNRLIYEILVYKEIHFNTIYEDLTKNLYNEQKHFQKYLWIRNYLLESISEFRHTLKSWETNDKKAHLDQLDLFSEKLFEA